MDLSHYDAIRTRLAHEQARLNSAITAREIKYRTVLVAQIQRELTEEEKLIGIGSVPDVNLSDDELLAELNN